jgi:hypothetical protein
LRPSSACGIEEIQDALDNLCHRTDFVGIGFQLAYCWRADSLASGGCAHRTGLQFADWSAKQSLIAADIPQYLRPFQNAIIGIRNIVRGTGLQAKVIVFGIPESLHAVRIAI